MHAFLAWLRGIKVGDGEFLSWGNIAHDSGGVGKGLVDTESHVGSTVVVETGHLGEIPVVVASRAAQVHLKGVGCQDVCNAMPTEMPHLGEEGLPPCGRELGYGSVKERVLLGWGDGFEEAAVDEYGRGLDHDGVAAVEGAVGDDAEALSGDLGDVVGCGTMG